MIMLHDLWTRMYFGRYRDYAEKRFVICYLYTYYYIFLLFESSNIPDGLVKSPELGGYAKMAWLPSAAASSLNRTPHAAGSQSYGTCTQSAYADSCSSPTCARQSHESTRGHLVLWSVLTTYIQQRQHHHSDRRDTYPAHMSLGHTCSYSLP